MRRKLFARLALLAFTAVCALWLVRLDYARKISTNVLDLIPAAEQAPEMALIRGFASDVQARVMLFALRDANAPTVPPTAAAKAFAAALKESPLFAEAVVMGEPATQEKFGREVFDRRFELLLPSWLAQRQREFERSGEPAEKFSAWLAAHTAADLETFLQRPEAAALQEIVPLDPLLLVPGLVARARLLASPTAKAAGHALVWARLSVSPLAEEGQGPVFAAIEGARAHLRAAHATVELKWSGVNRFAAASRARIEREMKWLNTISILAVLAVTCLFVRRVLKILHLVPVIAVAILGAWTVSTLVFERLHMLVFVIGSLLAGVAIDYGFYIYMQPLRTPDESYGDKLRRLLKPLLASCLTTVIGFSLLWWSELPLIRQIGVFVSAGLLCALAVAMLYFAQLERPLLEARQFGSVGARAPSWWRIVPRALFALAIAIALLGPWRLRWRDDVRELEIPSPELHANERALRELFGESPQRTILLTHGATVAEARQYLDEFLQQRAATAPRVALATIGFLLPTAPDWDALRPRLEALANFSEDLRAALDARGFTSGAFDPFFAAWEKFRRHPPTKGYDEVATEFSGLLTGPMAMLCHLRGPLCWFLTIVDAPGANASPQVHTVALDQLQSLNSLFTRYRWSALRLSLIGLALVIASVFAIYPFRRGLRIALIPAGSCFFVFGLLGVTGQTLNLFHLLGAFLGVCLSHNYAIFSSENAALGAAPPVPVRLSALCTAASFGVLGFSRIPVIHALGMTVALIVLTALAAVELEPLARRGKS